MSVWLGGETLTRGVLRTRRAEAGDVVTMTVFFATAVTVLFVGGSSVKSVGVAALVVALGLALCAPWELIAPVTGGSSLRGWVGARTGYVWRSVHHLTSFSPTGEYPVPAGVGSLTSSDENVEGTVVGVTEPTRSADRSGLRSRYLVTVVEAQGAPGHASTGTGGRWTALLDYLGSDASLVSHVSTVVSVTDWDATDHVWLTRQDLARAHPDQVLVESYASVVDKVQAIAANRRTWVVLRFPVTRTLTEAGGAGGARRAAGEQTLAVIERARVLGLRMRPLEARAHAALCRHLMDPEVSADDLRGLGGVGDAWQGAFPAFHTSADHRALVVEGSQGRRWMSTWELPAWTIEPGWLPTDFLYPVLTGLPGEVHRCLVVTCELQAAARARAHAKEDLTSDTAALGKAATSVSDGTDEIQAVGSQVRLADLKPGSGTVGVSWSMTLAFHAPSRREHAANTRRVLGALADSSVTSPVRMRYGQDRALGMVMPIARAWRHSRLERMGL